MNSLIWEEESFQIIFAGMAFNKEAEIGSMRIKQEIRHLPCIHKSGFSPQKWSLVTEAEIASSVPLGVAQTMPSFLLPKEKKVEVEPKSNKAAKILK